MKKTLLFFFILKSLILFAQNAADVEHHFGPSPGFGGLVECIVTQPDGKIIIKGAAVFRSKRTNGLVRINPDGSLDPTFVYNEDITRFTVKSIALQSDGKLLVGGNDNVEQSRVIRLNADGSKDTSFLFGGGVGESSVSVSAITVQSDGKILVANKKIYSTPQRRLIRLNADGSLDTAFNIGNGFDNDITAVAVQSDGKIVVSGKFSTFQDVAQQYLIRLNVDGSKDTSFNTGTGFVGNYVYSVLIQSDGKIIASGGFRTYQGVAQKYLIRLNPDGSNDTSFTNPINFAYMNNEYASNMSLQPDGKLIASFYKPNNSSGDDGVYRFNSDGSLDSTFSIASFDDGANLLTGKANADVLATAILNDGRILIGGKFNYCNKIIEKGIVCLNANGRRDSSFNKDTGFDAAVQCSAVQGDGKTLIGGYFDNFQGVTQKKLIRINLDGSKDTSFNPPAEFNDEVQSILLQADGKILIRGKFTNFGNSGRNALVRLNPDGSRDTSFLRSSEYDVDVIALQPNGKIIISAFVDSYPYLPVRRLFRLNIDGTNDVSFTAGNSFDLSKGIISSIVAQPDGKILVGGSFTTLNPIPQKYLVRLNPDGSQDTSFDIGTLYNLAINVQKITLQPDGKILVAGLFSPTTGDYQNYLVRLNSDGSKDPSFTQSIGSESVRTGYGIEISSLVLQPDGKILVGGEFDTFQGIAQSRLTRLNSDGSIDASFDTGNQFVAPIYSISLFPDGKINVSGVFSSYKSFTSSYFIRLKGTYFTPLNATTIQTNVTCLDSATGSASIVSVNEGKAPYTYLWSNGATTPEITGLVAGNYSCKIIDSESATITKNFIIITDSDIERPTITAPAAVTVNANLDCTATAVVLGTPITSDNCNVASVTNNAPAIFPVGNTTVIWTVKDASGNIATAAQTITVKDVTLPTITAPTAVTVNLTAAGCTLSATDVVLGTPVTADNCSVASVTSNAPKFYSLGTTIVTWTVKDKSNNSATATQIVTVKDVTPPTITAPAAIVSNTTFNCKAAGIALGNPITADNCSVASVTNDAPANFPIGNTTVTWTIKDRSNNTATATQLVTIKGLDVTVSYNEGKLTVAETAATYKWLTCNNGVFTAIPNENNPTFTPKQLGSYAVEVTKNNCTATSTCFDVAVLATKDFTFQDSFKLYPNPVKDFITIDVNILNSAKLDVFDVTGNLLITRELKTISTKLNVSNLPVGVYLFRVSNDMGTVTKKVIKD
ncbi:HYR domain-containing protein [Flavobacterium sp. FlaQc-50]|uniref:HYR domain-containing protein n=1 Tax=unclassified Flavobacterium TaxID=196869 RepID=UPI003756455A